MNKYKVLQDELWSYAETGMLEYKSSEAMIKFLENEGFDTEGFISDVNNTSFNELTTTEYNQILRERGVGSKAVKTAAKWLKKIFQHSVSLLRSI